MKNKLKFMLLSAVVLFAFSSAKALTVYGPTSWTSGGGYGTATKVDDVVTNIKGETTPSGGMYVGPYSKAGDSQKLADGITEEAYIEIDPSQMTAGELFEVTLGLKNGAGEYVSEAVVMAQKVGDDVKLTAGWAPDFEAIISDKGIYTYQWNMYLEDNKTYVEFALLKGNREIATTGEIDMDTITTADTKNPISEQEDVSVKYLWFCNVNVANGVNVYSELPTVNLTLIPSIEGEEPETIEVYKDSAITEEELEELVTILTEAAKEEGYTFDGFFADEKYEEEYDMTTPFTEDVEVYVKFTKIETEKNPNTVDNIKLYTTIGFVSLIGLAGAALYLNKKRYN